MLVYQRVNIWLMKEILYQLKWRIYQEGVCMCIYIYMDICILGENAGILVGKSKSKKKNISFCGKKNTMRF